jgi:hypothetical protein
MKIKMKVLTTIFTLLPTLVFAAPKCTQQKQSELEDRLATGIQNVAQLYLREAPLDALKKAFTDIAVAEQQLIVWQCYEESDSRLLLRKIRIHTMMDVHPAAFQALSHKLMAERGIDLYAPHEMFNTTIYLNKSGQY